MTITLDPQAQSALKAFQSLTPAEQSIVVQALEHIATEIVPDPAAETLSADISGQYYSQEERIQLEMDTLVRHFLHRRQLLENAFSAPQVAEILGTSRQTPHDRIKSQTLLAVRDNGKMLFPAWQFDPTGPDGVLEALPQVLKNLALSDYAKLNWLTRPNPYLEGLTPVEVLKQGQGDRVIQEAQTVGASQWS